MYSRFISDDQLLGYVLGALDQEELKRISAAVQADETLQRRLRALQAMPDPMGADYEPIDPPASMVDRLMDRLAGESSLAENAAGDADLKPGRALSPAVDREHPEHRSWLDALTVFAVGLILLGLVGPAITASRESARQSMCAAGLSKLGEHLRDFAMHNRRQSIPEIPVSGPLSFAGAYALQLHDAHYLVDNQNLWCPTGAVRIVAGSRRASLPSTDDFLRMPEPDRREWRRVAGGNYAYSLGVMVDDEHRMPTLDGPTTHAILADAPTQLDDDRFSFAVHFGEAANVLYEDGHVELLRVDLPLDLVDHPFFNHDGKIEAGLEEDDSALGSSFISPLGTLR